MKNLVQYSNLLEEIEMELEYAEHTLTFYEKSKEKYEKEQDYNGMNAMDYSIRNTQNKIETLLRLRMVAVEELKQIERYIAE